MTSFTKHCEMLEELKHERIPHLLQVSDSSGVPLFESIAEDLKALQNNAVKYRKKLAEKNPDRQTYGESMRLRVEAFIDSLEEVYTVYEDILQPNFEHALKKNAKQRATDDNINTKANEEAAAAQRNAEATAEAEEERLRQRALQLEEESQREAMRQKLASDKLAKTLKALEERTRALSEIAIVDEWAAAQALEVGAATAAVQGCRCGLLLAAKSLQLLPFCNFVDRVYGIMSRLVSNPEQASAQLLSVSHSDFRETISSAPGHVWLLRCVGYEIRPRSDCRALVAAAKREAVTDAEDGGVFEEDDGDLFWVATEPDPLLDYEKWKTWCSCLKSCLDFTANLSTDLTKARRNVGQTVDVLAIVESIKISINDN